ncbi:tRNA (adenine(58)-N(1))-methyltransferase non-catalytic subunit TRM6 [Sphaceloma murrayae]|uniref:tRNA (adenine(58)-N(1))-methyltransferase non-catalytic subunit TRM6 n=1 Tax=Sphaceloma murrayae TaxID=2082308 RepID=A0A2K1QJX3_9PEZI|nr:tRNA (adenine(58)-N(1))-methyltransferase non-catalytic subunit TRM6 [Sphaceloma murrayae]
MAALMLNSTISIGKFGTFPANLLIGRPLYTTYEIHEDINATDGKPSVRLRIVPATELNREALFDTTPTSEANGDNGAVSTPDATAIDEEIVPVKNNRLTVDDASRQALSMREIEQLKSAVTGSGKEIIEKLMSSHKNLDEKTVFSLAKYTLRKTKKYLRRFTVLPVDVGTLTQWMTTDREAQRILELREESLGLITAWSNLHVTPSLDNVSKGGKWLVLDDTGGLLTAAVAEKLGLLYPPSDNSSTNESQLSTSPPNHPASHIPTISSTNTIHLLHPASQPNLSILKYFSYSATHPSPTHPLSSHLLSLSWLQLLHPSRDSTYAEPPPLSQSDLEALKPARRSAYHRKRRRWHRCKATVDSARQGDFDGLIMATRMDMASVLRHLVPLVKGGGTVTAFATSAEALVRAVDFYGRDRRAAFLDGLDAWRDDMAASTTGARERSSGPDTVEGVVNGDGAAESRSKDDEDDAAPWRSPISGFEYPKDDFPVDPRLLLGASVQTSRAREWQVLPGRTHPVMTARGGGDGYVFTARRVLPFDGKVAARGNYAKRRKVEEPEGTLKDESKDQGTGGSNKQ